MERLATNGELLQMQKAQAAYYLALAQRAEPQLSGQPQRDWLERLDQELDNLRAAILWCSDHSVATGID